MQEVEVSRPVDAPLEAVERVLSPVAIVEFAGTYTVTDVESVDDGVVVVTAEADGLQTVLEFTETGPPYIYTQRTGPFAELYTSVSIVDDPVVVTARSCFTFGLPLSVITDWFATRERRTELRRLLAGIEAAATDR